MFYQVYHIKIFSFYFLYFSSTANVIALSILYVKHPNKHNNQQFNVKTVLKKKKKKSLTMLNLEWPDMHIRIWECNNI